MKKQSGFTLIELVIVIVILGILAVTATAKMLDIRAEAKFNTLKALEGNMLSALAIVYSQAFLENKHTGSFDIMFNGKPIMLYNGYPATGDIYMKSIITGLENWDFRPENTGIDTSDMSKLFYGYDNYACVLVYENNYNYLNVNSAASTHLEGEDCL